MLGKHFSLTAFFNMAFCVFLKAQNENVMDVFIQFCFSTDVQERSLQHGGPGANQPRSEAVNELHSPAAVPGQTAIP